MGAQCKCVERQAEISSEFNMISSKKSQAPKKKLHNLQNGLSSQSTNLQNPKQIFIVYAKNPIDQSNLMDKLKEISKNCEFVIEECQCLSESDNVESFFTVNGLSYGSFKIISSSKHDLDNVVN